MNVCFNGDFFPSSTPLLPVQNRSFKWGDGVFETMKVFKGNLLLADLHFERLMSSLKLLGIIPGSNFTKSRLLSDVLQLAQQNNCSYLARIRLAVYRAEDNKAGYTIEAIPLNENQNQWQEEGLILTLYPYARKSMDAFANLKTASFLPYVLAQKFAADNGADDALVLNAQNFLCDSSKANLFIVKGKNIYTPALHQGCVNGVMRRLVIEEAKKAGFRLYQDIVEEEQLIAADEVFLTNAIQMIRWVSHYKTANYTAVQTSKLYKSLTTTILGGLC